MSSSKRPRDPSGDQLLAKKQKRALGIEEVPTFQPQITVKLRSSSKATRNDPMPSPNFASANLDDIWALYGLSRRSDSSPRPEASSAARASDSGQALPENDQPLTENSMSAANPDGVITSGETEIATGSISKPSQQLDHAALDADRASLHPCLEESEEKVDGERDDENELEVDGPDDELGYGLDDDYLDDYDSDDDEFAEFDWLEQMDGLVHVNNKEVASCNAKLIRREDIRNCFWEEMERASEGTSDLAFDLFDRFGRLRQELYQHEFHKGSGVWGEEELSSGDILLFESISIKRDWRRQGLGSRVVQAVMEKARSKSYGLLALAMPGVLNRELSWEESREQSGSEPSVRLLDAATRFWRSLGFRRVGSSGWFAFSDSQDHPSRLLAAEEDWNQPLRSGEPQGPISPQVDTLMRSLKDPLASEEECLRQVQEVMHTEAGSELSSRLYKDYIGNTLLHLAAIGTKAQALLTIRRNRPHLEDMRNDAGDTPLEALERSLEIKRTIENVGLSIRVVADQFQGFSTAEISCLGMLSGTDIVDLSKYADQDLTAVLLVEGATRKDSFTKTIANTLRLKYGCTCGECIGGFMSPRMRSALEDAAADNVRDYSVFSNDSGPTINNTSRQESPDMSALIYRCLKEGRIPSEQIILDLLKTKVEQGAPVTRGYLQRLRREGRILSAAMSAFRGAQTSAELVEDFGLSGGRGVQLPKCRNDCEFTFVRRMCGYSTRK